MIYIMNNNKIKKFTAILLGILCIFTLMACGKKDSSEETTESVETTTEANVENNTKNAVDLSGVKLVSDGKLTVGMVIDYPPFEYYANDNEIPIGVDVDIVTNVANSLGLELEIKNVPWDDNLFTNIGKEYDIVCSAVTITDDRLKDMIFSNSYIDNYQSVVLPGSTDLSIKSFEDLNGLKVAVQKGTVSDELMNSLNENEEFEIELIENEVATDCFDQLKAGKVEAIVCDSTVAEGQVARNSADFVEAYRDEKNVEKFAIAIGKDNIALQTVINDALDKLEEDGTIRTIINSWF